MERIQQNYRLEPVTIKQLELLQLQIQQDCKDCPSKSDLISMAINKMYHDVNYVHYDTYWKYETNFVEAKQNYIRNHE